MVVLETFREVFCIKNIQVWGVGKPVLFKKVYKSEKPRLFSKSVVFFKNLRLFVEKLERENGC